MNGDETSAGLSAENKTISEKPASANNRFSNKHSNGLEETPRQHGRKDSCSSNGSSSISCATPDYDSGHYSCIGECNFQPGVSCSSEEDAQHGLEVRSMRSQLERLAKSERWYKNELKVQKRSKLDLLERLYVNERKFMRENQKLQADCKRLYALCNEIELKKSEEKDDLVKQLKSLEKLFRATKDNTHPTSSDVVSIEFELQQQRQLVEEHEHLIKTLRTQKQNLLDEIRSLVQDRDTKLLDIEKKNIALECENRTITKRCLELVTTNAQLEENLRSSLEEAEDSTNLRQTSQKQQVEIVRLTSALNDCKSGSETELNILKTHLETCHSKIEDYSQELSASKALCAEKQLHNDHLASEIEQYKKMRENYEKYVNLLQGNSAELDSKCTEIEHLQSVVEIQLSQIAALNKSVEDTKTHWKQVTMDLQYQLKSKDHELNSAKQHYAELDSKRSTEIHKLRDRLRQIEALNEKLLNQLRSNSNEITKKSSEIEELKAMIRGLEELNVENAQLKKLLEVNDEKLYQRKVHDAFVSELQTKIQKLTDKLRGEILKNKEMEILNGKNIELNDQLNTKINENGTLKQQLHTVEDELEHATSNLNAKLLELQLKEESVNLETSNYQSTIQSRSKNITDLQLENEELKAELTQRNQLQSELEHCHAIIKEYENSKKILLNASQQHQPVTKRHNHALLGEKHNKLQLMRETSQKVPETCDSFCQVNTFNVLDNIWQSDSTKETTEMREFRLLQRVIETEHRKHISRYELHIRTLLGKLRRYRNRDVKEKSCQVMEYEKQIQTLRERLQLALRHSSEIEYYKKQNLQLTSNLQSLTDDYKKMLISTPSTKSATGIIKSSYDEYYKLIDESNRYVPNLNLLTNSIDALREDISQIKTITDPCMNTSKVYLHPVKRLSLMDELNVADNFQF